MARNFKQGKYRPVNPKKYIGDCTDIVYRSSWELKLMKTLDLSDNVLAWSSETVVIPYISPKDNRVHRYFMDFLVVSKTKKTILIEVKPYAQTVKPVIRKTKSKERILNEVMTYSVNQAKWAAAKDYCKKRGWEFIVLTEKDINFQI